MLMQFLMRTEWLVMQMNVDDDDGTVCDDADNAITNKANVNLYPRLQKFGISLNDLLSFTLKHVKVLMGELMQLQNSITNSNVNGFYCSCDGRNKVVLAVPVYAHKRKDVFLKFIKKLMPTT